MRHFTFFLSMAILIACITPGCRRSRDEVWNDTKTAGRHVSRGVKTLGGKHGDSRQVRSAKDFAAAEPSLAEQNDFIAMDEDLNPLEMHLESSANIPQPKESPGDIGSSLPGVEAFVDPSNNPQLASIFKNVHFDYNSSFIKGQDNLTILSQIAEYMKKHPNTYIFIEGHCDKRGPAAYNLALGANRSNNVRNLLVQEGVNLDNLFTVSYGKERPLVEGDGEEFWKLNRRAQFKVYQR